MKDYMIKYTTEPPHPLSMSPWGHIVRGVRSVGDARDELIRHLWTEAKNDLAAGDEPIILYEIVSIHEIIAECTATLKETDE